MNVLHLTTHLNRGGISNYLLSIGSSFVRKGHKVFVASSGGEMEPEFKEAGVLLKTFPIRTKSELSLKIYRALPELIRWIRREKIDLIHAHTRVTQVMAWWIQCLTGIPFLTTAHGFYKRRFGRRLLPAWGKLVIAISGPVGDDLRDTFRVDLKRIRVVYNGMDLRSFIDRFQKHNPCEVRREYGIPEKAFTVGVTARLVPDKGHEFLIRALKSLESEILNLNLLIVGEGRHRKYLEGLVRELKLESRVHFTGNLSDVSRPLAAMDLFVLPAVWREGFGFSIVEAMACKKPVVVTNIWALNTIIQDRVNGILVEPRDAKHLAEVIRLLIKNEKFREAIGKAGQKTAEERFSVDRMALEIENVYEEVSKG